MSGQNLIDQYNIFVMSAEVMKKSSGSSSQKLGSFLSPGAPSYREKSIESQKGWSSERALLQPTSSSSSRRQGSSVAGLTPFNSSGRTIPSKWDDAERWICSPVNSGHVAANSKSCCYAQQHHQRRPKSKSGPIVHPGGGTTADYSNYSPTIPLRQGLVVKNLMVGMGSPFTTGVLAPHDALSLHHYYAHGTLFGPRYDIDNGSMQYSSPPVLNNENHVALPSVSSAPVWSELLCDPSSPNSQDDEKRDENKNGDTVISSPISRIDKGTQMSPPETENDDQCSSPKSSPTWAMDQKNCYSAKLEIRDVQVDSQATVIRWPKSYVSKLSSLHGKDLKKSSMEVQASGLDIADSTLDDSKPEREEAKIIAWESLQKAKAEAAIRKLEMNLENRRSSSMDKILNKLRRAQIKAEKKRSLIPEQQDQQVSKTWKFSLFKYAQIWSPNSCFGAHTP